MVKNLPAMQETLVQSMGQEDPLEKEMATHSRILAFQTSISILQTLSVGSMKLTDFSRKSTSLSSAAVKKIFWRQDLLTDWVGKLCKGKLNSGSVT